MIITKFISRKIKKKTLWKNYQRNYKCKKQQ